MTKYQTVAQIVVGSVFQFSIFLVDEEGRPVSLSDYDSGKLVFGNAAGTRTEIALTIPGTNPGRGELAISGVATAADEKWCSADLELVKDGATTIVPLKNKFEISRRTTPAAA